MPGPKSLKLLRTIRLDGSDAQVFKPAAEPGEWAVAGGFAFLDSDQATLSGKRRQAFAHGFMGVDSAGWSTFAVVATADGAAIDAVVERLAGLFVTAFGAPSLAAARPVARQEVGFVAELCREHGVGTFLAVERTIDAQGDIRERFRAVDRGRAGAGPAWEFVETAADGGGR